MIDRETVQRIKDTADIVEVVSDYVHLVRRGANYMGLCPFHNERTPSFSVNKRKNFCFCFSCKKGGSPVNFIMQKEGLSYHDALLQLAKKYGIEVKEKELTDEERAAQSEREAMLVANEWAMMKMETDMHGTEEGRDIGLQYLYQRGVTEEAARKFHLGYALDKGFELVGAARKAGHDTEVLKTLGLVGTSQSGREYDRFRGRVIFPIMNTSGKVIAFGGRDLKGGPAKYINSPESSLYKKSNELYGIFQARPEIVKEDKCFLVEGYLDVIGMWQSGMKNVVASSGTALTDGQIALIHRFTSNITLLYDGDAAGIKASLRGIDMLLNHNMHVKVLLLPDGDDPDSFARKHTPEEFRRYVEEHETDIIRFKTRVLLQDASSDPQKKIEAVNSVVTSLAHISDPISRDVYIQECSGILDMPETTISKSVAAVRAALVNKWKADRDRRSIDRDFPSAPGVERTPRPTSATAPQSTPAATTTVPLPPAVQSMTAVPETERQSTTAPPENQVSGKPPLFELEEKLIRYCVRYGFLDICTVVDDSGVESRMNVVEFIDDELKADNLSFTVDIFARIFNILIDMKPAYLQALDRKSAELEAEVDRRRKAGIEEIGKRDLMMNEIEREEKKMEEALEVYRTNELRDYARDFSGQELGSHEVDEIREICTMLLHDRQQLSNIYFRDGIMTETEEDRLPVLVPRALTELKGKILDLRLDELMQKMKQLGSDADSEELMDLMMRINRLHKLRSEIARDIGDRVIVPRVTSSH